MARNRIGIQFSGFQEMAEKLDRLQGDLKKITEEALIEGKEVATKNLLVATNKENYPAHGKYSKDDRTRKSIDTTKAVSWVGTTAEIKVGFDFSKSGLTSIFLMYGTPRMNKVQAIYDAIYGNKTRSEIRKIQKQVFENAIKKKMEG